ncbi:tetratricopeptide repeat protein [Microcoleus sp. D2_18a_B4]|uniref:tetratricopeptide repeat protein n=1 Tax=Microcoleus sp. D2_18a_B4 TaxID=3055329 RepID=UPI002FD4126D
MKNTFISRFTPSLMTPETLEAILVQRHALAERLVELIRVSALTDNKHFQLLIGPRGIGKTHLVSLIYHRVYNMEDLRDKLLIAWLQEEEWGIASFLDLLRGVFRAIAKEYEEEYEAELHNDVEKLYDLSPEQAEFKAAELLRDFVGKRVLLLIVENLEDVFSGLGDFGQKQLRAYIQNYSFLTILATSQSLFDGVKLSNNPFYDFFDLHELDEFNLDDAVALLNHIATLEGNNDLASFIQSPTGRDRIKVVHYLSGGSPRVYIVFSAFLMTPESLDKLVEPFMEMLDSLTPYYQDRMKYLSNQQRKIVDFLCDRGGAAPVKQIAKRCFIEQRTVSSQLKDLRDKGYVKTEEIGRESWYELREPLMRFCLEVKKQRNQPIRLIVDFIRLCYTRKELQQRLGLRMADVDMAEKESHFLYWQGLKPIPPDAVMEREYYTRALEATERNEEDPRLKAYFDQIEYCMEQKDYVSALAYAEKLVASRGEAKDWVQKGRCLNRLKRYEEALECLDKAIESDSNYARAWANRGDVLDNLKRYDEALVSYDRAIELDEYDPWHWAKRGYLLNNLKHYEKALESFNRAIELDANSQKIWVVRGYVLNALKRYEEALASFDRALEFNDNSQYICFLRGNVLNQLKRYEEALGAYDQVLEPDRNIQYIWFLRGNVLNQLKRYEEALVSFDMAIELDPNDLDIWTLRGNVLYNLKRYDEALESYERATELDVNYQPAWANRGYVLNNLKRYEEALAAYDLALESDTNDAGAWAHRGNVLNNLKRYNEALTSYDRAIELECDDRLVWFIRGDLLNRLKRYDEALASLDRAIELEYDNLFFWALRGELLNRIKRYDEALASLNRVIELGNPSSSVFFNVVIAILGLNHWDEGIAALDDAFQCIESDDDASSEHTEVIINNLFDNNDLAIWKPRIASLIAVYKKYEYLSILGQGIVRNIPALMSEMVSDKAARTWLELWQELTSKYEQFQIPIRLLNAAVRYKETKGDRRVLLELPIEERNLLEPLVSTKPE